MVTQQIVQVHQFLSLVSEKAYRIYCPPSRSQYRYQNYFQLLGSNNPKSPQMRQDPQDHRRQEQLVSLNLMNNTSIISAGNGAKPLLARSVPDLQFACLPIQFNHLESKVDTNGREVVINKIIVTESDEERRLADSLIAHYYYLKKKILLFYHSYYFTILIKSSHQDLIIYKYYLMSWFDWGKNIANNVVQKIGTQWSPPPEKDVFQVNGELSPDQFKRAGQHLIKICNGWQWKPNQNKAFKSKYFQQYLLLEKAICRRRLNTTQAKEQKKVEDKVIQEGEDEIVILEGAQIKEEEDNIENYRYYKMYIVYDQYYHTPRMYFSANKHNGTPVTNEDIRQDIQREYLDKTLTMEKFPFIEGLVMPTVHPCRHAAVLKTMSDSMSENGQPIESHFALLIFLKFISSVIPYVEFDTVGDLMFN